MNSPFFQTYDPVTVASIEGAVLDELSELVPKRLMDIWSNYGECMLMDGFLKIVNPKSFTAYLNRWHLQSKNEIVFAGTAFGDLLTWTGDAIRLLDFRHGTSSIINGGNMDRFFDKRLLDQSFLSTEFKNDLYKSAVQLLGQPSFDECFGYEPILMAGGSEKLENLNRVKLIEHIDLIAQFTSTHYMPTLSDGKALQIAQDFLKDKDFRETVFGKPYFVSRGSKLNDVMVDYWVVPFEHRIFDMESAFIHIEEDTASIMYVQTAHGRQFINGEPEPAQNGDDDEDWDNL